MAVMIWSEIPLIGKETPCLSNNRMTLDVRDVRIAAEEWIGTSNNKRVEVLLFERFALRATLAKHGTGEGHTHTFTHCQGATHLEHVATDIGTQGLATMHIRKHQKKVGSMIVLDRRRSGI